MIEGPSIAAVGALIGDPARANILTALLDGRRWTATELSIVAGVAPQTASGHLRMLVDGALLTVEKDGRHRYFRLANHNVAEAVELLATIASSSPHYRRTRRGPREPEMRVARTCYDHIAGHLGVSLMQWLTIHRCLELTDDGVIVTASGEDWLEEFGIDIAAAHARRRPLAKACLDWSERRPHLAGAIGAALADRFFSLGWIKREAKTRALTITQLGKRELRGNFGLEILDRV